MNWKETTLTASWFSSSIDLQCNGVALNWYFSLKFRSLSRDGVYKVSIEFPDRVEVNYVKISTRIARGFVKQFLTAAGVTDVEPPSCNDDEVEVWLTMKKPVIEEYLIPYFKAMAPDVSNLFRLVDSRQLSILKDTSFYEFDHIEV